MARRATTLEHIGQFIQSIRGTSVMIDSDLARLYGVSRRCLQSHR